MSDDRYSKHNFTNNRQLDTKQAQMDIKQAELAKASNVSSTHSSSYGYQKYLNMFLKYSFYLSVLSIFALMILIVLQFLGFKPFSFLPDDGGFIEIPLLPTNRQKAFTKSIMPSNTTAGLQNLVSSNYTISLDVYIDNVFITQSIPRVILYRADKDDVELLSTDNTIEKIFKKMPQTNCILY